jgi:hypothetical protein
MVASTTLLIKLFASPQTAQEYEGIVHLLDEGEPIAELGG